MPPGAWKVRDEVSYQEKCDVIHHDSNNDLACIERCLEETCETAPQSACQNSDNQRYEPDNDDRCIEIMPTRAADIAPT